MKLRFTIQLTPEERSDLREAIEAYKDWLMHEHGHDVDSHGNFADIVADNTYNRLARIQSVL